MSVPGRLGGVRGNWRAYQKYLYPSLRHQHPTPKRSPVLHPEHFMNLRDAFPSGSMGFMYRTKPIQFMVTEEEKAALKNAAHEARMNLSDFLRSRILASDYPELPPESEYEGLPKGPVSSLGLGTVRGKHGN